MEKKCVTLKKILHDPLFRFPFMNPAPKTVGHAASRRRIPTVMAAVINSLHFLYFLTEAS